MHCAAENQQPADEDGYRDSGDRRYDDRKNARQDHQHTEGDGPPDGFPRHRQHWSRCSVHNFSSFKRLVIHYRVPGKFHPWLPKRPCSYCESPLSGEITTKLAWPPCIIRSRVLPLASAASSLKSATEFTSCRLTLMMRSPCSRY